MKSIRLLDNITQHRILWVFLLLISALSIWDITSSTIFRTELYVKILYVLIISILKATIVTTLYCICKKQLFLRIICIVLITAYSTIALINIVSYLLYGFGITRKLILIIAQTTSAEIAGFTPGLLMNLCEFFKASSFYLILVLFLLITIFIRKCKKECFSLIVIIGSMLGCIAFLAFCLSSSSGRSAHILFARVFKYSHEIAVENKRYQELLKGKKELPDIASVSSKHLANTVIVIIGESAIRKHHSLYGYPLPTTPKLDALRDSLYIFTDALSSSKSTSGNMERILSFKEDDNTYGDGLDYPLVIDYFNEAGYKTFWLSNQEQFGSVSNTSGVMAMNSNVIEYVGADNSEDALSMTYDEALLPYIDKALTDSAENKLIFVHLLGSHVEFKNRYPQFFNPFDSEIEQTTFGFDWLDDKMAQRRAEYDNSIRYTDILIEYAIRKTSALDNSSVLIYLSDHGENVYDEGSFSGRDESCAEVPFIVYANANYRNNSPFIIAAIENAVTKPCSTANLVHALLTITGSSYSYYESRLDVLSPMFEVRPRYVDERIWPREHLN